MQLHNELLTTMVMYIGRRAASAAAADWAVAAADRADRAAVAGGDERVVHFWQPFHGYQGGR